MDYGKEGLFLKEKFGEYYSKNFIDSVPNVERREFGYGVFKRKIANRNLGFENLEQMNKFLREFKPLFFSYSNAYYSFPSRTPMQNKELIKGDIIYEFDADEISSTCKKTNGAWECEKTFGVESFIEETMQQGETKQWFLEKSLEETKKHVFRLVDIILNEFNFSDKGLSINFSGKAGYHVHLRNKELQNLKKRARIELVDYLTGTGIYYDNLGFELDKKLSCPKAIGGWNKKLLLGIKQFLQKDVKEISTITNTPPQRIRNMLKTNDVDKLLNNGFLPQIGIRKNKAFWKEALDFIVETYAVPIDRQTSIDMHKIIRVPNTLHGDTGLLAKKLTLNELKEFNPVQDAVVFDSTLFKVYVKEAPKFKLNGNEFGPYKEETVEVPLYCAIYLIGKGSKLS